MFRIFLIMYFDVSLLNLRSSSNDNREPDDLPKMHRVLIERLRNLMFKKGRSEIRCERMVLPFLSIASNLYIVLKPNSKFEGSKRNISKQYKLRSKRIIGNNAW